jgi:hypothetical protein
MSTRKLSTLVSGIQVDVRGDKRHDRAQAFNADAMKKKRRGAGEQKEPASHS